MRIIGTLRSQESLCAPSLDRDKTKARVTRPRASEIPLARLRRVTTMRPSPTNQNFSGRRQDFTRPDRPQWPTGKRGRQDPRGNNVPQRFAGFRRGCAETQVIVCFAARPSRCTTATAGSLRRRELVALGGRRAACVERLMTRERTTAYGRCPSYGKRQERVSHELVGRRTERVAHTVHKGTTRRLANLMKTEDSDPERRRRNRRKPW
jgi:hypothetical protein